MSAAGTAAGGLPGTGEGQHTTVRSGAGAGDPDTAGGAGRAAIGGR